MVWIGIWVWIGRRFDTVFILGLFVDDIVVVWRMVAFLAVFDSEVGRLSIIGGQVLALHGFTERQSFEVETLAIGLFWVSRVEGLTVAIVHRFPFIGGKQVNCLKVFFFYSGRCIGGHSPDVFDQACFDYLGNQLEQLLGLHQYLFNGLPLLVLLMRIQLVNKQFGAVTVGFVLIVVPYGRYKAAVFLVNKPFLSALPVRVFHRDIADIEFIAVLVKTQLNVPAQVSLGIRQVIGRIFCFVDLVLLICDLRLVRNGLFGDLFQLLHFVFDVAAGLALEGQLVFIWKQFVFVQGLFDVVRLVCDV